MTSDAVRVTLRCDTAPIMAYIEMLSVALSSRHVERPLPPAHTLARVTEGTAGHGQVVMVIYPSDAFLAFGAEVMAVPACSFTEHGQQPSDGSAS